MRIERWIGAAVVAAVALGAGIGFAQEPPPAPAPPPAAAPAPAPAQVAPTGEPTDKAVIAFDDKAKDNGELKFVFTPTGGQAVEIRVTAAKGMDDEDCARAALKEFKVALGEEKYKFELDDGTKVIIHGKKDATFFVSISTLNVPGLSVRIK